ncbi:hypothetical protein [Nonomuraea soli]|uniref:Uncharacterized protein n=1 Tax=Nonomuraea soli TaxID=1032476 RepID=A0A7W0CRX2_9ACTN|nr:hypothetical protein [Nonomuraea soli]MBA2896211.1 hypothetical protein [Nonomuraea soli]
MDVVVDPEVPEEDARVLRESTGLLARIRNGWAPRRLSSRRLGLGSALIMGLMGFLAVCTLMIFIGLARTGPGLTILGFVGFIIFTAAFINQPVDAEDEEEAADREIYERARRHHGRYVLVDDLDESSARLLNRTRGAIRAITGAAVNADGLLDTASNAVTLRAQEWEIARLLAKLSSLRGEHRRTMAKNLAPEVAAIAEPLGRALEASENAVVRRVEALEGYAAHVAEAERAYQAHLQVEELRARLPKYEQLVAEAGATAVPELERLSDDAEALQRALGRTLESARDAFRYLDG